jgi:cephalosporin hydroxylase
MMKRRTGLSALLVIVLGAAWLAIGGSRVAEAHDELTDAEVIDRFQQILIENRAILKGKWLGIPTVQHPMDMWVTQEILAEVVPDVIVETGSYHGGSAAMWAMILEHLNPKAKVITVDIRDRSKKARELPIVQERVEFILGSSTDPDVVAKVKARVKGKKVLVILDSLHTEEHVLGELAAYAPLVDVGSYLIVQDTHLGDTVPFYWYHAEKDRGSDPGPAPAIRKWLEENGNFEVDRSRERYLTTNNRGGFLKRVK